MPRLFVALLPPETVRAELAALATPLDGMRWTPQENLHLTLRFVGETEVARQDAFASALERVRVEPFILPVEGVGIFPSRGVPRVLWGGVGKSHTRLFQLRKQVDEALLSVDSSLDVHSFHPHFTVGRVGAVEARDLAKFLARHEQFEAPPFRVSEFHLMVSARPAVGAPVYRSLRHYPLRPK